MEKIKTKKKSNAGRHKGVDNKQTINLFIRWSVIDKFQGVNSVEKIKTLQSECYDFLNKRVIELNVL